MTWNCRHTILLMVGLCLFSIATCSAADQPKVDQTIRIVDGVEMTGEPWNSLEVVKLIVGLLTPAAMLGAGMWLDRRIKEFEHRQWSNQKVIEKRLEVYEKITPLLNELMCYFIRVGGWKELDPTKILGMKRDIDKIAHIYAPLFSPNFLDRYNDFIGLCFATFRGDGKDAALRTESAYYREAYVGCEEDGGQWQPEWNECFTGSEEASDRKEIGNAYRQLVGLIAHELGVGLGEEQC